MTRVAPTGAAAYNTAQLAAGNLTAEHVTELVRFWQSQHGLTADGMAGPLTLASLDASIAARPSAGEIGEDHWLSWATRIAIDSSWYGGVINGGSPRGVVAHFTDTDPGTAINMARRRQHPYGSDPDDRLASWHLTIETDGSVVQMIPLNRVAWHAGSSTARPVKGLGPANQCTIGVELVGYGKEFPAAQVDSARRVWRAIVRRYNVEREYAMLQHSVIDPTRRDDPGPVWMARYAETVLQEAYR